MRPVILVGRSWELRPPSGAVRLAPREGVGESAAPTVGDHAGGAADGELEVGPVMAMPLVRGRGTVLVTDRVVLTRRDL